MKNLIDLTERRKMRESSDPDPAGEFPNLEDELWLAVEALALARESLMDALAYEEPLSAGALEAVDLAREWIESVLARQEQEQKLEPAS